MPYGGLATLTENIALVKTPPQALSYCPSVCCSRGSRASESRSNGGWHPSLSLSLSCPAVVVASLGLV
eukprot:8901852-Pyramimonas_sp.AAC.1